jgi:methylmalonyl-CoA mutase
MVLRQLAAAFGLREAIEVHAITALANKSIYDPYTNLLRVTTEALSAATAGVDSLTVQPAGFQARLAKNVQLILKEESHLDKVADPAGGSYYIESITDSIAAEAWKLFQQIEAEGGFAKAQATIDARLAASRAAKEKAIASRRRTMVGVNNYPDLNEKELEQADSLNAAGWRLAQSIESIRLRTERHAAKTGKTPKVLLLRRGDLKMKMARAQFCQNFLGCAGFDIVENEALEPADLVVLCSSDPEYLALAAEICPQTKSPVLVAGNPKEQIDQLKAAGVAGFLHVLSNMVDTLTELQDKLGIAKEAK